MMQLEHMVNTVTAITQEVCQTMLGMEVEVGAAYVDRNPPGPSHGIISLIGLAGAWMGTGSLCCSGDAACKLSSRFLMTEFDTVNEDVLDAMAELTNMIIGNFKTAAEEHLGPLGLSIPTVIYGMSFSARSAGKEEWLIVPFGFEGHTLDVRLCLTPNRGLSHLVAPAAAQTAR